MDIIKIGEKEAVKIIKQCCDDIGIKASAHYTGYPQVWARDSMITMLGATQFSDKDTKNTLQKTLCTLRDNQTDLGLIPASIVVKDGKKDFRAYADGNAWYVIGQYNFFQTYHDKQFLEESWISIQKTMQWLECQDVYQSGLLAMQEGADWMDHIAVRGRGLSINALYYQSLISAAALAAILDDTDNQVFYNERALFVRDQLRSLFWVDVIEQKTYEDDFLNEELNILYGHKQALLRQRPYFLPYIGFRTVGTWLDTLGNLYTILFDIADKEQGNQILSYIQQVGVNTPFPAKAMYPTIRPGDIDWRDYYLNKNLNLPDHYHNGGIWPFIGGFYVAALVKDKRFIEAEQQLEQLARVNKKGKNNDWEFNEWMHGITGEPMGFEHQAWSAAMFLYASACVKKKKVIFFDA
jgi:glycogen debranching enzyme